jgi:hypothetical protein
MTLGLRPCLFCRIRNADHTLIISYQEGTLPPLSPHDFPRAAFRIPHSAMTGRYFAPNRLSAASAG